MKLSAKEILFRQGEEGNLFRLDEGLIKITRMHSNGKELLLNILASGEVFPHHSLTSHQPYFGTAIALTNCSVEVIPHKHWYQMLSDNNRYKYVAEILQKSLQRMQTRIILTTAPVCERLPLLREWISTYHPGQLIEELLTQEELGQFLGLTRETVNRLLKRR